MDKDALGQRRLLLASENRGKLKELRALVEPMNVFVQAQGALGVAAALEPHDTFVENALAKARHGARESGWPTLADDSGLCCEALGGAPGVRSARYAGQSASDEQNNALVLRELASHGNRRAHYRCVVVAMRWHGDPEPLIADGCWDGEIVDRPQGSGGFGYDPHFWLPQLGCTAAQLDAERKNSVSHRAIAMRAMVALLHERWGW
ncbi:MAG TPA: RdgB/HAM1 family non-canonical purine NTP pyrophosphatase [Burkholderiaceae bacterium]|nr:RdgB/HAM1 family non-canonical purine NTP pyrophosphatase [Burkholderiaceae bacterium]